MNQNDNKLDQTRDNILISRRVVSGCPCCEGGEQQLQIPLHLVRAVCEYHFDEEGWNRAASEAELVKLFDIDEVLAKVLTEYVIENTCVDVKFHWRG